MKAMNYFVLAASAMFALILSTLYYDSVQSKQLLISDKTNANYTKNVSMTDSLSQTPDLTISGIFEAYNLGHALSEYPGDFNGDGFDDFLICANSTTNDRTFLYYGGSVLSSVPDIEFKTDLSYYEFNSKISLLNDINGDGFDDLAIGSPAYNDNAGRAYVFLGGADPDSLPDFVLEGAALDGFGNSVSSAGDINDDGFGDIIIGASRYNSFAGRAYIYFGGTNFNNVPDLILYGENSNSNFGKEVSDAGDVNADGYDDVIVGAHTYSNGQGKIYIYYGAQYMNNDPDVVFTGVNSGLLGCSVSTAGDVNGDGYDDIIAGEYGYLGSIGRAHILFGGSSMNGAPDVTMTGVVNTNWFGYHVSNAGDINADGYSDVVVGAVGADERVQIFYGGASMDNQFDYEFVLGPQEVALGYNVSFAGDLNNDGASDVIFGAQAGAAYVFLGRSMIVENVILDSPRDDSSNTDLSVEFQWYRFQNSSNYGLTIASDPSFSGIVYYDTTITDTSKIVYVDSYSTNYYWKVQARDSLGILRSSDVWHFTTREQPLVRLLQPANDTSGIPLANTLIWQAHPTASAYRVLISTDSTFQNVVFTDTVFNDTSISIEGFSYLTKYFWSVGARDTSGQFYYSDIWRFITLSRPLAQLANPNNDSVNAPINMQFIWGQVPYAISYRLQVASDSTFSNVQYNYSGLSDTAKLVMGLNHSKRYFWRVGARDLNGYTYYSSYRYFTTMPQLQLNVTVLMEGMYFPLFNQLSRRDTVEVILRESTAPYSAVDTATSILDSLSFTGTFVFPKASAGRYYIIVKHFNCVETWSRAGGEELIGGITSSYNFTTSANQAYGGNMKVKGGKFCIFSGDVNQSGFIDGTDLSAIDNAAYNLMSGRYQPTDLNGDNFTDGTDFVIGDNNRTYIGVITP